MSYALNAFFLLSTICISSLSLHAQDGINKPECFDRTRYFCSYNMVRNSARITMDMADTIKDSCNRLPVMDSIAICMIGITCCPPLFIMAHETERAKLNIKQKSPDTAPYSDKMQ